MRAYEGLKRLTVLSDTHGSLRSEVAAAVAGTDLILHAGDVGAAEVLSALRNLAPTAAVRGNVDSPAPDLPATASVSVNGVAFYVLHRLEDLDFTPASAGVHCVVSGHSHRASLSQEAGVTYLNPGSVGPRRFQLPITWAELSWTGAGWKGTFRELVDRAGPPTTRQHGEAFTIGP